MPALDLWKARERGDRKAIEAASPDEIRAAAVALCDRCEAQRGVDFDKLMSIGMWVAQAGHDGADEIVVQWLADQPSGHRLDIAASLLTGLWLASSRRAPVDPDLVARLAAARPAALASADAESSYAQAMNEIVRDPKAAVAAVRTAGDALEAVLTRGTGNAATDKHLASWVPAAIRAARARRP